MYTTYMHAYNKNSKGIISVFVLILLLISIAAACFYFFSNVNDESTQDMTISSEDPPSSFSFSVSGDFGSSENAVKVLEGIASNNTDFTLALGDLGYGGNGTEETWCNFVKNIVGSEYPFQIVAGNHDDGTKDGNILAYRDCLPNKIDTIVGDYGLEYYFDYNNLARFILISPDIDELGFSYIKGSEHYKWLADVIDDARSNNIEWIILGMHKNCITVGVKECEIGEDILNLSIDKSVDLILQGHEHAYMRSKQLKFNSSCTEIIRNTVNSKCISGNGNTLKKNEGSIVVISGTGGVDLREVNAGDKEAAYFETYNGSNSGNSFGFSRFTVSNDEIQAEFIPVTGNYVDTYKITNSVE